MWRGIYRRMIKFEDDKTLLTHENCLLSEDYGGYMPRMSQRYIASCEGIL